MADKRIYELDLQSTYSGGLFVACDDSGFTSGARKIDLKTIAPRIDTLSSASTINTATWLVRLNSGAGNEFKSTMDNFIEQFTEQDTYLNLENSSGQIMGTLKIKKFLNFVIAQWRNEEDRGTPPVDLYQGGSKFYLPEAYRPASELRHYQANKNNLSQSNIIIINPDGSMQAQSRNQDQQFGFSYLTF